MAVAAVCAVVGVGAPLPASTAVAELPEVQPCIAQPVLARQSYGSGVLCLQFALIMHGFSVPYNGLYSPETEDAVRWFQATHPPLVVNGVAGEDTLMALGIAGKAAIFVPAGSLGGAPMESSSEAAAAGTPTTRARCVADATLTSTSRGQSVTCLQQRLIELGWPGVKVTGIFDKATQDALRAYQKNTPPLTADAVAGPRTLAALDIWSGMTVGNGRDIGPGPFPAPMLDLPEYRLTAQGIPVYGNRTPCTPEQAAIVAAEFANDGADAETQQWAVYVASREGGCRYEAVNINARTKDDSHCTFQLNALSGMFAPHGSLGRRGWSTDSVKTSLQACADAASDLWVFCGRGPWTKPYTCTPPWAGSTVDQPPALLPPPPETAPTVPAADEPVDPASPTSTDPPSPSTSSPVPVAPASSSTDTTVAP